MTVYLYNKFVFDVKSVQNGAADFNYFSKSKVHRFMKSQEALRLIKDNWGNKGINEYINLHIVTIK